MIGSKQYTSVEVYLKQKRLGKIAVDWQPASSLDNVKLMTDRKKEEKRRDKTDNRQACTACIL